jgi:hypothetical protein
MRKKLIGSGNATTPRSNAQPEWLDIEEIGAVEVTSEDPDFPIESALTGTEGSGWRAAQPGKQLIRMVFDNPMPLHRIRLEFSDKEVERTQEFTLKWSQQGGPLREIVRQQWNFSPTGATAEVEDYRVELDGVSVLELALVPDLSGGNARATLAAWRVA